MSMILEVNNLSKIYGKQEALKNVSISIPEGCIMGLLGPNGSGKTTMIKIITGLITDYSGSVSIDGMEPGPNASKILSYLPDKQHVPDWLKVLEAVKMFADFYDDFDKERALEMIGSMNVPIDKKIKSLSKGMQEKLQLSLVMSRRAKLYILDEPIAAVDPASRDFIVRTILGNCTEGSAILLSTHIISDIEPALDSAVFLKDGQVILADDVDRIRDQQQKSIDQYFREVFKC